METRLTIKHLAPYLPYNLKAEILDYKIDYVNKQYDEIVGFHQWDKNCLFWSALTVGGSKPNIERIKPILRPLSDLSKLGVDDIPINEHTINLMIEEKFNEDYGLFEHYKGSLELVKEGDSSQGYDSRKAIFFEVFEEIRNELLKGHYDLFGLIDKGLAIDMNLINNQ